MSNEGMLTTTKVLIAEQYFLVAQGLRKLLEGQFDNVEIVEDGRDLFRTVASFKPDVILLDSGLAQVNGIEPSRHFPMLATASKVIIVSSHADPAYVIEAFRTGVSGYVLKGCDFSELTQAIRQAMEGRTYVTPLISQRPSATATDSIPSKVAAPLTPRQREVLQLVAEGYTAKEIANQLNLSVKTAVFHKMAIMDKLALRTTAELTRYAIENNIVPVKGRQAVRVELNAEVSTGLAATAVS
jgi:DNA-binding NarL/FixJ family response regulator